MNSKYETLRTAYLLLEGQVARAIGQFSLSLAGYNALAVLGEGESIPITQLAKRLLIDDSTATRVIDTLERLEFARRVPDPFDRRVRRVEATAAGRSAWREASNAVSASADAFFAPLSPHQARAINDSLARLVQIHLEGDNE